MTELHICVVNFIIVDPPVARIFDSLDCRSALSFRRVAAWVELLSGCRRTPREIVEHSTSSAETVAEFEGTGPSSSSCNLRDSRRRTDGSF